jgi:hypothetical protein
LSDRAMPISWMQTQCSPLRDVKQLSEKVQHDEPATDCSVAPALAGPSLE